MGQELSGEGQLVQRLKEGWSGEDPRWGGVGWGGGYEGCADPLLRQGCDKDGVGTERGGQGTAGAAANIDLERGQGGSISNVLKDLIVEANKFLGKAL
eukprot:766528-Hanusia_phi.AAC.1